MSNWIDVSFDYDGEWTNPAHWSGGTPTTAGSIANFGSIGFNQGQGYAVYIDEAADITVGQMTFTMTGTGGIDVRGSFFDSGTGIADLIFDNGANAAVLTVSQPSGSDPIRFLPIGGLRMTLASNLLVNTVGATSNVIMDLAVAGPGKIIKIGDGRLELNDAKTFTGGFEIQGGSVVVSSDSSLGTGNIVISNNAQFVGAGTIDNAFLTLSGATGTQGAAKIGIPTGSMTLTGALHHLSQGALALGSLTASFSAIFHNPVQSSFVVNFTTIGNAYSGANLFNFAGTGTTQVRHLDTNGFVTTISNLTLIGNVADFADLQSSNGTLNVIINDVSTIAISHVDAFISGTAGADSIVVNVLNEYNFSTINWSAWTAGTDTITYNGSANNNLIIGSVQRETFNGGAGNDTLSGMGGIDTFNGGSGNDLIALGATNDGSFVDGGADTDTLRISGGGTVSIGSLASIEAVNIQSGGILLLSAAEFATGLAVNSVLSGTGTILVSMSPGDTVFATGMTTAVGADITLAVSGSTGIDVIKSALGVTLNVGGGDSADQIRGGNLADAISGGNGNDKLMGLGGADQLTGGAGADQFRYLFASDAGTGANADQILDFVHLTDKLDFRILDANPAVAGRQALTYIGTSTFANNGIAQVRWTDLGADLRVEVDLDGNGTADMAMLLVGAGAQVLTATDFLL